jgi:hypothetical protein
MRSPHDHCKRCAFQWGASPACKIATYVLFVAIALMVIVSGMRVAMAATLGLDFGWPGLYDTETGDSPASTISSRCVSDADPTLAAGGTIVELATNPNYGRWPPNGQADKSFEEALTNFFAGSIPSHNWVIGQPKLIYDKSGDPSGFGRNVLIASAYDNTSQPPRAWITIGAAAVDYPGGLATDCTYSLDVNLNSPNHYWVDKPHIGMTKDAFVIVGDMRAFDKNSTFQYSKAWVIPKRSLYNLPNNFCPPSNFPFHYWQPLTNPKGSLASSVVPAKSYYTAGNAVTYLVSANPNGGSGLNVWTLDSDNLGLSSAKTVPVRPYSVPPAAPQKGTNQLITTGDARLANAVYFQKSGLWTVHTVACPSHPERSCFKWYQLDPVAGNAKQDSDFGYAVDSVYAPAVAANRNGDAVFVYNSSSSNHYVDIDVVGRAAGDPANTLQSPGFLLKAGRDVYTRGAPALHSSADLDPTDDNLFWVSAAYAFGNASGRNASCSNGTTNHDWATWVGAVSFK